MAITLTGIRGVVLDLDDTLFPERDYVFSGFAAVGEWLRRRMTCPADPAARLREMFESGRRHTLFNDLLAEWHCAEGSEWVPEMVACYREHVPSIQLFPDARRAIDRWRGHFKLGLLTDGPCIMQQSKIETLNLTSQLDDIICTDRWGREFWKPHPRAFEEFERLWNDRGRELVYIADNPVKDFVGPNRRGWQSVQIVRLSGEYSQSHSVPDGAAEHRVDSLDAIEIADSSSNQ